MWRQGVSIGEKSKVVIDKFSANSVGIGLAIKDESHLRLNEMNVESELECVTVFRKKQEFYGAFAEINKINSKCNDKIVTDSYSKF